MSGQNEDYVVSKGHKKNFKCYFSCRRENLPKDHPILFEGDYEACCRKRDELNDELYRERRRRQYLRRNRNKVLIFVLKHDRAGKPRFKPLGIRIWVDPLKEWIEI